MFKLTALPATYGDCLWIEYGEDERPNVILVDAGPSASKALKLRLKQLAERGGHLELVVVTHVDRDHIGGMLTLLKEDFYGVKVRDFWFNGFRHLSKMETFGEKQGERLTGLLLEKKIAWNVDMQNAGVMVRADSCPVIDLPGGAKITLLSPDEKQLERLRACWVKICGEADLYEGIAAQDTHFGKEGLEAFGAAGALDIAALANQPFTEDSAEANGSSIAFILEYKGKRALLGADAYPSRILKSLALAEERAPFKFDIVKVPHHGSENNVSKEFLEVLDCHNYLFSSNGSYYQHPTPSAVARVVQHSRRPLTLSFNYKSIYSAPWDSNLLRAKHNYTTLYGTDDGITIDI